MRWSRREQSTVLLKLAVPLLLLIPAAIGFQPARSHPVETCPVNPFQALEASLVCSVKQNFTTVPTQDDNSTCFESEAALPSTTDAPKGNSPHQDDRRLSEAMTETSSSSSSIIEPTTSSALISTPSSTARTDKEVAWSEIDDSLGLSWTPELEIEYANAQRDFELHTQALASNVQTSIPSADEVGSRSEGNSALPEFPSFAEWKERHLAASIAAGTHSSKENAELRANRDKDLKKSISVDTGKVAQKSTSSKYDVPPADPLQVLWDENGQAAAEDGTDNELAAHSRRIIHPAPHAGTGDPLLDPLVSLRDRTNYASFDCSATLIRSSKSTKSASAILSSKKDRYMLTPCAEKEKYVIVELCDEIQIDTIVLANLEFFSSMFKLFRVSGGTAYPESAGTWRDIGTFRASNARGMQVFRPSEPTGGGFYRYLRIDFLSHYGSEYYCPVSLLKVYGLTQLDAYRRDEERQNRLANAEEDELLESVDIIQPEVIQEEPVYLRLVNPVKVEPEVSPFESQAFVDTQTATEPSLTTPVHSSIQDIALSDASRPASPSYVTATETAAETAKVSPNSPSNATTPLPSISSVMNETSLQSSNDKRPANFTTASGESLQTQEAETATQSVTQAPVNKSKSEETTFVPPSSLTQEASTGSQKHTSTRTTASSLKIVETQDAKVSSKTATSSPSLVYRSTQQAVTPSVRRNDTKPQVIYTHAHNVNHQPNESIYGTIMKRLLALEVNATLSTTYLEEQTRMVWETFRRIEDRLTNMEKARSKYDQLLRRVMLDLELHRARHEAERTELSGQLNVLSREMVMEKRLGIAQLLALVILMFFVILTRGSPSSPILNIAHSRTPKSDISFPVVTKTRRPRSLRDEPLDHISSTDFRSIPTRERRGMGSGSRGGIYANGNGLSRNTSTKRPYRTSNNVGKRPLSGVPAVKRGFEYPIDGAAGGMPAFPLRSAADSPQPPPNTATISHSGRTSRAASPIAETEGSILGMSDQDLSSSTITLRGSTPPLYPVPTKTRRSPVETLRRKLKLMQPRRAASLDATGLPVPYQSSIESPSSSVLDRRKKFSMPQQISYLRDRSETTSSLASEDNNSKAWLSTSEDSEDERSNSTPPSIGSPSFGDFSRLSAHNSPSKSAAYVPPSPDPSDAETPAPIYRELPIPSSPGKL